MNQHFSFSPTTSRRLFSVQFSISYYPLLCKGSLIDRHRPTTSREAFRAFSLSLHTKSPAQGAVSRAARSPHASDQHRPLSDTSTFHLRLLTTRRGIDFTLVRDFSPWLGVYVPIPLGVFNGAWSLHCASCGYLRYQGSGSCATRAGICGTAWGCSGPSCALNLGLDLGLLITATLAALPAGASAKGCGYDCYVLLCFPCAPNGGEGMAVAMVLATLGLASAVARKMWLITIAVRGGGGSEGFLPW